MTNISSYIDHTFLKPTATTADIQKLCQEANQFNFAAVCIPPYFLALAKKEIKPTVQLATVIGFPFGYSTWEAKKAEILQALDAGAEEIDMVINLCALFANDWGYLHKEILACLQPIRLHNKKIKVIIESGNLSEEQIVSCCRFYAQFKVDFLKTSTGYGEKGAELHAVKIMKENLPKEIKIKASGGIRTFEMAKAFIDLGASRIGTSSSVAIVQNQK